MIQGGSDANCLGLLIIIQEYSFSLLKCKNILDINDIFYKYISAKVIEQILLIHYSFHSLFKDFGKWKWIG